PRVKDRDRRFGTDCRHQCAARLGIRFTQPRGYSSRTPEYGVGDTPGSGSGCLPACTTAYEKLRSLFLANSTTSSQTARIALASSVRAGSPECRLSNHRNSPIFWSSTVSQRQSYRASRLPPKNSGKSTALTTARSTAERLRARSQSTTKAPRPKAWARWTASSLDVAEASTWPPF